MRAKFDHVIKERARLVRAEETIEVRKTLARPYLRGGFILEGLGQRLRDRLRELEEEESAHFSRRAQTHCR